MPSFGKRSLSHLATCDPRLQLLLRDTIKISNFSIICGHRGEKAQNEAYKNGTSKLKWPNSKHNTFPSVAVDIIPYPFKGWDNLAPFIELQTAILTVAEFHKIEVFHGAWFPKLQDWPHWELVGHGKQLT